MTASAPGRRPRWIFFDAAFTLFRPCRPVGETYARIAGRHGIALDPGDLETRFREVWRAMPLPDYRGRCDVAERQEVDVRWWRDLVRAVFAACGEERPAGFEACFRELFDHYGRGEAWTPYPEVPAVLGSLRESGACLGIISNFDRRLERVLADLDLAPWFGVVTTSVASGASKPEPGIFASALAAAGAVAGDCLHVGDDPEADWEGAARAGLRVFRLRRPENDLRHLLDGGGTS